MFKCLLVTIKIFIANSCFCQAIELQQPDSISIHSGNEKFVSTINRQYNKALKKGADTVFLVYEADDLINYAILIWKIGSVGKSKAFYKSASSPRIKQTALKNTILNTLDIASIYRLISSRPDLNQRDTVNFVPHDFIVYSKFYFGNNEFIKAAYESKFIGTLYKKNVLFFNEYRKEKYKFMKKEK